MKPLWVNRAGTITDGMLKGTTGHVTGFDSEKDIATVKLDEITYVHISSDYIFQND